MKTKAAVMCAAWVTMSLVSGCVTGAADSGSNDAETPDDVPRVDDPGAVTPGSDPLGADANESADPDDAAADSGTKPSPPSTDASPIDTGTSKPDTSVPDTFVADTNVADTKVAPDTSVADTAAADTGVVASAWRKANLTWYTSYPDPGSEECIKYSGCEWSGQFAALPSKMPESWVKANNIASVHSKDFAAYKLHTLRLRQGTHQIDVKVYDMCADSDCSGCCTANSKSTGFLLDIEKYTAERFGANSGIVEWVCLDC